MKLWHCRDARSFRPLWAMEEMGLPYALEIMPFPPRVHHRQYLAINPLGTDGFEFVEYTAPDPAALGRLFETMGFTATARHRSKDVTLYKQGDVNFIVNAEADSFAQSFARVHGPSCCAIAFRVKDAAAVAGGGAVARVPHR